MQGVGSRVEGLGSGCGLKGFRVEDLGSGVQISNPEPYALTVFSPIGCMVYPKKVLPLALEPGLGFGVQGSGFRVWGSGSRVWG